LRIEDAERLAKTVAGHDRALIWARNARLHLSNNHASTLVEESSNSSRVAQTM